MPPPTISVSTLLASESRTVSFVETFEPPTMATNGRAGFCSAYQRPVDWEKIPEPTAEGGTETTPEGESSG